MRCVFVQFRCTPGKTYEVADATANGSRADLCEELGDLLLGHGEIRIIGRGLADPAKVLNSTVVYDPQGGRVARYDKIHMFDVDLDNGESWRESAAYEPGTEAVVADLPIGKVGLAICYDLRFPQLFRAEALAGAEVLTVPAAFTRQTGEAHWHALLRARAIENGAWVIQGEARRGTETFAFERRLTWSRTPR